jgi:hypothetical protein
MEIKDAEQFVEQLQHAHRLSVAFYRRFLPTLDKIASQVGCRFGWWAPTVTDKPCQSTTRPSSKWAWDFVPLFASSYLYYREEGNTATPEDVGLLFRLFIDNAFSDEERERNGVKGQPDAVNLPIGNAILQVVVFRPTKKSNRSLDKLWKKIDYALLEPGTMREIGEEINVILHEWPLADFLHNSQQVVEKLKQYTE